MYSRRPNTLQDEHVHVYLTQISLCTTEDVVYCKVLPTSLKGATLGWFTHLAPSPLIVSTLYSPNSELNSPLLNHITLPP